MHRRLRPQLRSWTDMEIRCPDACVEFKLYNYAEFYTVARKQTDAEGKAFLTAGKGDMLVWASKDGKFGYAKLSFGKDHELGCEDG